MRRQYIAQPHFTCTFCISGNPSFAILSNKRTHYAAAGFENISFLIEGVAVNSEIFIP